MTVKGFIVLDKSYKTSHGKPRYVPFLSIFTNIAPTPMRSVLAVRRGIISPVGRLASVSGSRFG